MLALALAAAAALTADMWTAAQPVYQATLKHPYLTGLADGTLPRASFDFYLIEDAKYLRAFGEALETLAAKAPRPEWAALLRKHATESIEAEQQLHRSLVKLPAGSAEMAPTNYAYANHFRRAVRAGTFAEGLASLLPCYWIYWEVGKVLAQRGSKNADYQRWIKQYSDPGYGATVQQVLAMMDAVAARLNAAQRQRAIDLFVISARYEYLFWDMAWRRETWPPYGK